MTPGKKGKTTPQKPPQGGRIPPHNLDAEQGVLGAILINGSDILNECQTRKLEPCYFYDGKHQTIYQAMLDMSSAGIPIEEIGLHNHLIKTGELAASGGIEYINEIMRRVEIVTEHAKHWIEIVREGYFRRKVLLLSQANIENVFAAGGIPLDQLLSDVERSFFEISQARVPDSVRPASGSLDDAIELMDLLAQGRGAAAGIPSGLPDLDKMTYGFHPGQMIVIAARPGMGKTAIALNIIEAALFEPKKRGQEPPQILMFSLEMPARELSMRMIASRARVDIRKLAEGFNTREAMMSARNASAEIKAMPLLIDDTGGQTWSMIQAKSRRAHAKRKLGMIVIDYIQLIVGDSSLPREQQIAEASRGVKSLAKELGIPVIALAQLNRKNEDENRAPRMSDLRESGSIEQDADVVILISRPGGKKEDDDEIVEGPYWKRDLIVAKQRNGPTGDIATYFNFALTRFETPARSASHEAPQPTPAGGRQSKTWGS